ncbi:MAG: protein kinase [Ruminococcus sp.]|nr:protein kinase [Ruminococcus sp.]
MLDIGERLSSYEPLWENWYKDTYLGGGNFGRVYRLRQTFFGETRYCAVKVIPIILEQELSTYQGSREQLIERKKAAMVQEIKNMYKLKGQEHIVQCLGHNIKDIYDNSGRVIGFDILIQMEQYVSLPVYLRQNGAMSTAEIEKLAVQIAEAIKSMHDINMLHRDIKASNIYVDSKGNYLLGDLGIAKQEELESFSTLAGTQPFIAPEVWNVQNTNKRYTKTADIYSFGITLYYLLNGNKLPLVNENATKSDTDRAICDRLAGRQFPPPQNGSDKMKSIVMQCCAYDPQRRFQSMDAVLKALGKRVSPSPAVMPAAAPVYSQPAMPVQRPPQPYRQPDNIPVQPPAEPDTLSEYETEVKPTTNKKLAVALITVMCVLVAMSALVVLLFKMNFGSGKDKSSVSVSSKEESSSSASSDSASSEDTSSDPDELDPSDIITPDELKLIKTMYVKTDITSMKVYLGPGFGYNVVSKDQIPIGTELDIYGEQEADSTTWGYITYDGITGWIDEASLSDIPTVVDPYSPSYIETMFVDTKENDLSMRYGPSYDFEIVTMVARHDEVDVYGEQYNSDTGDTWAYITYKGSCGWVNMKYLSDLSYKTETTTKKKTTTTTTTTTKSDDPDLRDVVLFSYAYSSSSLPSDTVNGQYYTYGAENAVDGDIMTCWSEGAADEGIGESITVYPEEDEVTIDTLYIANGIMTSETAYRYNNRVKRCRLEFSDGTLYEAAFPDNYSKQPTELVFPEELTVSWVTITIVEVYEGEKYDDTCIAEIYAK